MNKNCCFWSRIAQISWFFSFAASSFNFLHFKKIGTWRVAVSTILQFEVQAKARKASAIRLNYKIKVLVHIWFCSILTDDVNNFYQMFAKQHGFTFNEARILWTFRFRNTVFILLRNLNVWKKAIHNCLQYIFVKWNTLCLLKYRQTVVYKVLTSDQA